MAADGGGVVDAIVPAPEVAEHRISCADAHAGRIADAREPLSSHTPTGFRVQALGCKVLADEHRTKSSRVSGKRLTDDLKYFSISVVSKRFRYFAEHRVTRAGAHTRRVAVARETLSSHASQRQRAPFKVKSLTKSTLQSQVKPSTVSAVRALTPDTSQLQRSPVVPNKMILRYLKCFRISRRERAPYNVKSYAWQETFRYSEMFQVFENIGNKTF